MATLVPSELQALSKDYRSCGVPCVLIFVTRVPSRARQILTLLSLLQVMKNSPSALCLIHMILRLWAWKLCSRDLFSRSQICVLPCSVHVTSRGSAGFHSIWQALSTRTVNSGSLLSQTVSISFESHARREPEESHCRLTMRVPFSCRIMTGSKLPTLHMITSPF